VDDLRSSTEERARRGHRWPLGGLTLLVVMVTVVAVVLLRDDPQAPAAGGGITVPGFGNPVGSEAPDFTTTLLDGTRFSLSDHLATDGRPVLLNLWASWCGPCRVEMPHLDAAAKTHAHVYFLGVAVDDDPAAARAFAEEIGVTYPLAIDERNQVGRRYPSFGLPATFLIDEEGRIVRTVYGQVSEAQIEAFLQSLQG
jgi:thiol-disulfide isomerase/thioredoxin